MFNDTSNLPTLKENEENLFHELQVVYQTALVSILEEVDLWLMENRDNKV